MSRGIKEFQLTESGHKDTTFFGEMQGLSRKLLRQISFGILHKFD